jgi:hypothetical protein
MVKKIKVGDLVLFHCEFENYKLKIGLLLDIRKNPTDVATINFAKKHGAQLSQHLINGPREVADILYKGQVCTAWLHNMSKKQEYKNEEQYYA